AFLRAGKPGARLYYATMTPEWAEAFVPTLNRFNVFGPGTPPNTAREELAIHFVLPPELLEAKLRAIGAHRSQVEGIVEAFGEAFLRESQRTECFRLAEVRR
ncbi:MAG: hypothetical protein ACRDIF_02265, partial [Actinomycetota bacterium]